MSWLTVLVFVVNQRQHRRRSHSLYNSSSSSRISHRVHLVHLRAPPQVVLLQRLPLPPPTKRIAQLRQRKPRECLTHQRVHSAHPMSSVVVLHKPRAAQVTTMISRRTSCRTTRIFSYSRTLREMRLPPVAVPLQPSVSIRVLILCVWKNSIGLKMSNTHQEAKYDSELPIHIDLMT